MRALLVVGIGSLAALSGCGLENLLSNTGRAAHPRPASVIRGTVPAWAGMTASQITVTDGDGVAVEPFAASLSGTSYELRLPSSRYSMLVVRARAGNATVRALVPSVGEESEVSGVDLDARNTVETLVVEARLARDGQRLKQLTPAAYVGDGVSTGTRTLLRANLDTAGPTQDLLHMVEQVLARADPASGTIDPDFFRTPIVTAGEQVTTSPLNSGWLARNPFDYDGDGAAETTTGDFDAKLVEVARLYRPAGCPDPAHIRLMFTVDFNEGALNGNCGTVDRFKWLDPKTIQPDRRMYFVGWIYTNPANPPISEVQDPAINSLVGASTPNQIPMYDDGTNGDEAAGDGIWTVYFDVPYDPAHMLRLGYKYTWGTRGHVWTGTEEWPGNSRILEVVDVNGDGIVYRRDVFGDEASNKDFSNSFLGGNGSVTWTTAQHGPECGLEARERKVTPHSACTCSEWITPQSVGPLTVACTGP